MDLELNWIFAKTSSETTHFFFYFYIEWIKYRYSIDYYVPVPTEPMTIHNSMMESIRYGLQTKGMLW